MTSASARTAAMHMKRVMENLGINDGSFMPIANDENKALMEHIQEMLKEKSDKTILNQQMKVKLENLHSHSDNSKQDINHNLKVIDAYRSQSLKEHHMFKLAENDETSLTKQSKNLEKTLVELEKRQEWTKNEMDKIQSNINKLTSEIQWLRSALTEWTEVMERGEETNKLIAKYCKEDKNKAEILEGKRRTIQNNINAKKQHLLSAFKEQKSLEHILERTSQLYRQSHMERRQMVNTWKEAVNTMNLREKDITAHELTLETAKITSKNMNDTLNDLTKCLDEKLNANKDMQYGIDELHEKCAFLRSKLTEIIDVIATRSTDVLTLKKLIQNITNRVQQQRQKNRKSIKDREQTEDQMNKLLSINEKLAARIENLINKNDNAQERLKELDELVEHEEKSVNGISSETTRLSGVMYRSQKILLDYQNENKAMEMEITALEVALNGIQRNQMDLEKEMLQHTEIVYSVDYKQSEVLTRIDKLKGAGNIVDPDAEMKFQKLQHLYDERKHSYSIVKDQSVKAEDDMRKMTDDYNTDMNVFRKLENILKEKQMCCDGGEKLFKQLLNENQEQLVEQNLLRMRVHQFTNMIEKITDKSYNLEKHKIDLELTMNERMLEIKAKQDLLQLNRKHLHEELQQLNADIGERKLKIDAMIARYENAIHRLGYNDDGSMVTAVQIKIETAQEKQILLREGNELNEKVITAEKDIKAIENTLILLNYSNETYKRTMGQIGDDNEEELNEFNQINEQYCAAVIRLKDCRGTIIMKIKEIEDLNDELHKFETELDNVNRTRLENNDTLIKLHREILEQKSKMDRAQRELLCAKKATKHRINDRNFLKLFEKDLTVKELDERNTSALQQLADMVDSVIGMGPIISKYLYEKGLNIPQASSRLRVSQTSGRSEQSAMESEYSLKACSLSSKFSQRSLIGSMSSSSSTTPSTSPQSSASTKKYDKSGNRPSIVVIDFPQNNTNQNQISSSRSLHKQKNFSRK